MRVDSLSRKRLTTNDSSLIPAMYDHIVVIRADMITVLLSALYIARLAPIFDSR